MKTQFITDDNGKRTGVILPIKLYDKMVEGLEELEDIQLYDKAKQRKQGFVNAEDAFRLVEKRRKKK